MYFLVRQVSTRFSIPPQLNYEVEENGNLNITCVAVGSPMPNVKWQKGESPPWIRFDLLLSHEAIFLFKRLVGVPKTFRLLMAAVNGEWGWWGRCLQAAWWEKWCSC